MGCIDIDIPDLKRIIRVVCSQQAGLVSVCSNSGCFLSVHRVSSYMILTRSLHRILLVVFAKCRFSIMCLLRDDNKKNAPGGLIFLDDSFVVGNLKVTKLVGQEQIDSFVAALPQEKKADVKDVITALHGAGLIDVETQ